MPFTLKDPSAEQSQETAQQQPTGQFRLREPARPSMPSTPAVGATPVQTPPGIKDWRDFVVETGGDQQIGDTPAADTSWGNILRTEVQNLPKRFENAYLGVLAAAKSEMHDPDGINKWLNPFKGYQAEARNFTSELRKDPNNQGLRSYAAALGADPDLLLSGDWREQLEQSDKIVQGFRATGMASDTKLQEVLAKAQQNTDDIQDNTVDLPTWSAKGLTRDVAVGAAEMAPAVLAGLLTRNLGVGAQAGAGVMGGQVYGHSYLEALQGMELPHEVAKERAAIFALAEFATEALPLKAILSDTKRLSKIMDAAIQEGAQEGVTQILQQGYDFLRLDQDITFSEFLEGVAHATVVGAGVGGTLAAITPGGGPENEQSAQGQEETGKFRLREPQRNQPEQDAPENQESDDAPDLGDDVSIDPETGEVVGGRYTDDGYADIARDQMEDPDSSPDVGEQYEQYAETELTSPTEAEGERGEGKAPEQVQTQDKPANAKPENAAAGVETDYVEVERDDLPAGFKAVNSDSDTRFTVETEGKPDNFSQLSAIARKNGGKYSRARGKRPAFVFDRDDDREKFLEVVKGLETAKVEREEQAAKQAALLPEEGSTPEWSSFGPETGTLGVPRAEMPQVKAEHRGALVNFLKGQGITSELQSVPANTLKPTQAEFSPEKVQKAVDFEGGNRSILVSNDNYVVDGHHQWLSEGDNTIQVIRIDAPIKDLLKTVGEFPSAEVSDGATEAPKPEAEPEAQESKTLPPDDYQRLVDAHGESYAKGYQASLTGQHIDNSEGAPAKLNAQDFTKGWTDAKKGMKVPTPKVEARTGLEVLFDGRKFPVKSFGEAKAKWIQYREQSGLGNSEMADTLKILDNGKEVARISYNGRIWEPGAWRADAKEFFLDKEGNVERIGHEDDAPQRNEQDEAAQLSEEPVKWFGSDEKANAWVNKQANPEAYEIKQNARKFEIFEKQAITTKSDTSASKGFSAGLPDGFVSRTIAGYNSHPNTRFVIDITKRLAPEEFAASNELAKKHNGSYDGSAPKEPKFVFYNKSDRSKFIESLAGRAAQETKKPQESEAPSEATTKIQRAKRRLKEAKTPEAKTAIEKEIRALRQEAAKELPIVAPEKSDKPKKDEQPKYGKTNKVFTEDAAEEARRILKDKLNNLNSGIDPETMRAGLTLAGYHIEAGARSFAAYSKAMIEDLGDGIKPYLRSFYESVRHYPGFDAAGMDTSAEIDAQLAETKPVEPKDMGVFVAEKPKSKAKASKEKSLTQDWGVDDINGYNDEGLDSGNDIKAAFLKEAKSYLTQVSGYLLGAGYGQITPKIKAVSVNQSGVAGSGSVSLALYNPDIEAYAYVNIEATTLRGVVPTTDQGVSVMYRVSTKDGDNFAVDGINRWAPVDLSSAELADIVIEEATRATANIAKSGNAADNAPEVKEDIPQTDLFGGEPETNNDVRDNDQRNDKRVKSASASENVEVGRAGEDSGRVPQASGEREKSGSTGSATTRRRARPASAGGNDKDAPSGKSGTRNRAKSNSRGIELSLRSNYRITDRDSLGSGGSIAKARGNLEAIRILKALKSESREPTQAELQALVKYVGWGASDLANKLFPSKGEPQGTWKQLRDDLKELLTEQEYETAARSTQYAHYTSKPVIDSIWSAVSRMGLKNGMVFEGGMGTGNFTGLVPASMNLHYSGVEMDVITAGIAKVLYPESGVINGDFTKLGLPENYYDLTIGNPPFASVTVLSDPKYRRHKFKLHDYFIAKQLDALKPGGVAVFVTSKGTMDKANQDARQYISDRANLLGAIRLPQTAFKENAGTEVVTDILFFQKRKEGEEPAGRAWLESREITLPEGKASINEYFASNPQMILGKSALQGSMYGPDEYTVLPTGDIEQQLAEAVEKLPANVVEEQPTASEIAAKAKEFELNPGKTEGSYYFDSSNTLRQVTGGVGEVVPVRGPEQKTGLSKVALKVIQSYVPLRDAVLEVYAAQSDPKRLKQAQEVLHERYDAFVKANGPINRVKTTIRKDGVELTREPVLDVVYMDPYAYQVAMIERYDEATGEATKHEIFYEQVKTQDTERSIESAVDALSVTLNDKGHVDLDYLAELYNTTPEAALAELDTAVYEDPATGKYVTEDDYLSGNVKAKLQIAKERTAEDSKYQRNVKALEEVQPEDLPIARIPLNLGAMWIPSEIIQSFAEDVLKFNGKITSFISGDTSNWQVAGKSEDQTFATGRRKAVEILAAALNRTTVKVYDTIYVDGSTKQELNKNETAAANQKVEEIRNKFQAWVLNDSDAADLAHVEYNARFNTTVPRKFNGAHLTLPGLSSRYTPHDWQRNAVWRTIVTGNTYYAHTVGSGKTLTSTIAAMELKRLGLAKKPAFSVLKSTLKQFAMEFLDAYPNAKVLIADERQLDRKNLKRFYARLTAENWDAVVLSHQAFEKIALSSEFVASVVEAELDDYRQLLDSVDEEDRAARKQIERQVESMEQRLEAMSSQDRKIVGIPFEETGIDFLFVDEAHHHKKIPFPTNQSNLKGVDPNGSNIAYDMYLKSKYLNSVRPNRAIVLMSGTPVTNTVGEVFNIQRYLQPKALESGKISSFDTWSATFTTTVTELEMQASGTFKPSTRLAKFVGVPALMRDFLQIADVVTDDDLKKSLSIKRPAIRGGQRQIVTVPRSPELKAYQGLLASRIAKLDEKKGPPKKGDDNILVVIGDAKKASIDMRLVGLPQNTPSKLDFLIEDVFKSWEQTKDNQYKSGGKVEPKKGATQLIFTEIRKAAEFDIYDYIKDTLVKKGVPVEQIAYIQDYGTTKKKKKLFREMNTGVKRILLGGSKNLGTGTNVQQRLYDINHLDIDYLPANIVQREGRGIRQGNKNPDVGLRAYATEGTVDAFMWQLNETKQRMIDQVMSGNLSIDEVEDISDNASQMAQAKALASGNPLLLEQAGLSAEVTKLRALRDAHINQTHKNRRLAKELYYKISLLREAEKEAKAIQPKYKSTAGDDFAMTVFGKKFVDRKKAGDFIQASIASQKSGRAGTIAGLELNYERRKITEQGEFSFGGIDSISDNFYKMGLNDPSIGFNYHDEMDSVGLVKRIENAAKKVGNLVEEVDKQIQLADRQRVIAEEQVNTVFQYGDDLALKEQRLDEIDSELAAGPETDDTAASNDEIAGTPEDEIKYSVDISSQKREDTKGFEDVLDAHLRAHPLNTNDFVERYEYDVEDGDDPQEVVESIVEFATEVVIYGLAETTDFYELNNIQEQIIDNKIRAIVGSALSDNLAKEGIDISPDAGSEQQRVTSKEYSAAREKGLDLSHKARMRRAREMGFDTDTVYYHGTLSSFEEFGKAKSRTLGGRAWKNNNLNGKVHFFTTDPSVASGYAEDARIKKLGGGNVVPVYLRSKSTHTIDAKGKNWFQVAPIVKDAIDGRVNVKANRDGVGLSNEETYDSIEIPDTIIIKNVLDSFNEVGEPTTVVVSLDPANIRSINAAFDPEFSMSTKILSSVRAPVRVGQVSPASLETTLRTSPLGEAIGAAIDAGRIVIHRRASEMPGQIEAQALTMPDGTIHLAADQLDTNSAMPVLMHEAFHSGAEAFLGTQAWKRLNARLDAMYKRGPRSTGNMQKFWRAAQARIDAAERAGDKMSDARKAEEFGAYVIEEYESAPPSIRKWFNDLIGAIKKWILKFFGKQAGKITPAQLASIAKSAIKTVEPTTGRTASAHSVSDNTKAVYEQRIDELFNDGRPNREGVKILDSSDVLVMLGFKDLPMHVAEGKIKSGQFTHRLTAEHWKKIPEWLENPVAVFDAQNHPGRLVFFAPETLKDGSPISIIIETEADHARADVHLAINAYERAPGTPVHRWAEEGLLRYLDQKRSRAFNTTTGLRLPRVVHQIRGSKSKIYSERDLVKYRAAGGVKYSIKPEKAAEEVSAAIKNARTPSLLDKAGWKLQDYRSNGLYFLGRNQLVEIGSKVMPTMNQYLAQAKRMDAFRNNLLSERSVPADQWRKYAEKNKKEAQELADLMHDTTIAGVDPSVAYEPITDAKTVRDNIKVLKEKARGRSGEGTAKWMDLIKQEKNKLNQEKNRAAESGSLTARWNKLSPEAKEIYITVRDSYAEHQAAVLKALIQRVEENIASEKHRRALIDALRMQFENQRVQAPYFPLSRFGEYWVRVNEAGTSEYSFHMFESKGAQEEFLRSYDNDPSVVVTHGKKLEAHKEMARIAPGFVADVQVLLDKAGSGPTITQIKDEIYQMYLTSLPDLSVRKHFIHRGKIRGYSQDAIRSFSNFMFHSSYQLARLRYAHRLENLLEEMRSDVGVAGNQDAVDDITQKAIMGVPGMAQRVHNINAIQTDPDAATDFLNELQKRHDWAMNPKGSKTAQFLTSFGFVFFLGVSPAAAMVNLTQTPMVAYPVMGAKWGYGKAAKELTKAMGEFYKGKQPGGSFSVNNVLKGEEKAAFEALEASGILDKTLGHDLAGMSEQGFEYNSTAHRVMSATSYFFHHAERFNREITALATYRLARKAGQSHLAAVQAAGDVTETSHFDYSSANKARLLHSDTARVLLLFRQFSLNMTYLLARSTHQAFKGASKATKTEARRRMAGILGMTAIFAGLQGLPLFWLVKFVLETIFDDEDEPWVFEAEFRKGLVELTGSKTAGAVISRGPMDVLTGATISSRVSLNNLWIRDNNRDLEGQAAYQYWLEQVAGPIGGAVGGAFRWGQLMDEGRYGRAFESLLPVFARNALKAWRFNQEGANSMRGDALIEDVATADMFKQALGFTPTALSERYEENSAIKSIEQRIINRRSRLLDRYAMAFRLEDIEGMEDAAQDIGRFNVANPTMGITNDSLRQSLKSRQNYSNRATNGIILNPRLLYLGEEYDFAE